MNTDVFQNEITKLRKAVNTLRMLLFVVTVSIAVAALFYATRSPRVLRLKGLVIVDEQGHDRILLGAPTPVSSSRKRKDAQTESLVFLGDDGSDRVIVGQTPDTYAAGQTSKRIAEGWGSLYFDPNGTERGGMGFLGNGRAAVVLDRADGDALGMMVDDKSDYAGLLVNYPSQDLALEMAVKGKQPSLSVFDNNGKNRATLTLSGNGRPAWQTQEAGSDRPPSR